jgi:hypothetical protein
VHHPKLNNLFHVFFALVFHRITFDVHSPPQVIGFLVLNFAIHG